MQQLMRQHADVLDGMQQDATDEFVATGLPQTPATPAAWPGWQGAARKLMARVRAKNPQLAQQEQIAQRVREGPPAVAPSRKRKHAGGSDANEAAKQMKLDGGSAAAAAPTPHGMRPMGMAPRTWLALVAKRVRAGELNTPAQLAAARQELSEEAASAPGTGPRSAAAAAAAAAAVAVQPPMSMSQQERQWQQRQQMHLQRVQAYLQQQQAELCRVHAQELTRMQQQVFQQQAQAHNHALGHLHSQDMDRFLMAGMVCG